MMNALKAPVAAGFMAAMITPFLAVEAAADPATIVDLQQVDATGTVDQSGGLNISGLDTSLFVETDAFTTIAQGSFASASFNTAALGADMNQDFRWTLEINGEMTVDLNQDSPPPPFGPTAVNHTLELGINSLADLMALSIDPTGSMMIDANELLAGSTDGVWAAAGIGAFLLTDTGTDGADGFTLGLVIDPDAVLQFMVDLAPPGFLDNFTGDITSANFQFTGSISLLADDMLNGVNEIPEPLSIALLGSGLIGLGALRRRRRIDA